MYFTLIILKYFVYTTFFISAFLLMQKLHVNTFQANYGQELTPMTKMKKFVSTYLQASWFYYIRWAKICKTPNMNHIKCNTKVSKNTALNSTLLNRKYMHNIHLVYKVRCCTSRIAQSQPKYLQGPVHRSRGNKRSIMSKAYSSSKCCMIIEHFQLLPLLTKVYSGNQ